MGGNYFMDVLNNMNNENNENNKDNENVNSTQGSENNKGNEGEQSYYQSYQSYRNERHAEYEQFFQNAQNSEQGPDGEYYYTQPNTTNTAPNAAQKKNDAFGVASFCLSLSPILLLLCCCCCFPLIAVMPYILVALEVLALVFAFVSKKKMGKFTGFAIAGLVISLVIIIAVILAVVLIVVVYNSNAEYYDALIRSFEEPGYYKEFFQKFEPEFYEQNREDIDDLFESFFGSVEGSIIG